MKTWKWVLAISAVLLAFAFLYGRRQVADKLNPSNVQEAEKQIQTAKTAIREQAETIKETRLANYRQVKKAVKSAVEKADSIDYNDVCDEFNAVISGARERNAERRRSDSAD